MRLVSRLVRDQAEAEDVVQEAFIKAYRALPQFRGDSAFIPGFTGLESIPPKTIWSPKAGVRPRRPRQMLKRRKLLMTESI